MYVLSCAIAHVQTGLQNACFVVRIAKPAKIYTFKKAVCVLTTPARPSSVPTAGTPRTERGPGASLNMMDFRFCELQNRRRKRRIFVRIMMRSPKKKKGLHRNSNGLCARN